MNHDGELSLRDYLSIIWDNRWIVVVVTVVITGVVVGLSLRTEPMYRSSAEVLVRQAPTATSLGSSGVVLSPRALENELRTARGSRLRFEVIEDVGPGPVLDVRSTGDSDVFSFEAESPDAQLSAAAANRYAEAYINHQAEDLIADYQSRQRIVQGRLDDVERLLDLGGGDDVESLEQQSREYGQELEDLRVSIELARTSGSQIIDQAGVAGSPYSPKPVRDGVLAGVFGALAGVGLAFVRANLDTTLRTPEDLAGIVGKPTLTVVPMIAGWRDSGQPQIVARDQPRAPASEAYRSLRTTVQFLGLQEPLKTIAVTSPRPGDGKTTTAANLAVVSARAGQRVVLVDCDLRQPRVHEFFGLPNHDGFTSLLLGQATEDVAHQVEGEPNLVVVTAGPVPPDPSELLSSPQARDAIARIAGAADLVLIDTAPVLAVTDPLIVAGLVDGVILVAAAGSTDTRQVGRAVDQLSQVDAPLLGAVLNRFQASASAGYGTYSYGY